MVPLIIKKGPWRPVPIRKLYFKKPSQVNVENTLRRDYLPSSRLNCSA